VELSGRAFVGTIRSATRLEGARVPAYRMEIDFGPGFGVRRSSAQLTDLYRPEDLEGRQVVALVDLGEKRIAGYTSQVLVLGVQTDAGVVLLAPDRPVPDGLEVF
jgi:tRNA-binding protein